MSLVIRNGYLIDPESGTAEQLDILVEGESIARIGHGFNAEENIDATDCVVCPGLVDIHVHFREPGFESKETIATGSRSAARGGYTSVVAMPNTNPPIDNGGMVALHNRFSHESACIRVYPAAAATKGRQGTEMTEMADLKTAGAVAVTDDGSDITSSWVMRHVLEYASMVGLTYLAHCEDTSLMDNGAMNEGFNSTRLGLPGMPKAMEEISVDRLIRLSELTGAHVHVCHVSTAGVVDAVRRAKERGLHVTCETAPHYWTLTDDAVERIGSNAKMNPPLREQTDIEAIKEGLADGTIDCIATDHAPHTFTDKDVEFQIAPFGIVGLETSLGLAITGLVREGIVSLERAVELMTLAPARILDIPAGVIKVGGYADITVFSPDMEWTVTPEDFASKGRNTPFAGMSLFGKVRYTLCAGRVVYKDTGNHF